MSIFNNPRSEIANVEAGAKSIWSRVKPLLITALISSLVSGVFTKCAFGAEPTEPAYTSASPVQAQIIGHSARAADVPVEKEAPKVEGHPITSVVVTQCNLIVAVYMTMPDGRLLRFDKSAAVASDQLMTMAYSATRSERVEVSCNETGIVGTERRDPI